LSQQGYRPGNRMTNNFEDRRPGPINNLKNALDYMINEIIFPPYRGEERDDTPAPLPPVPYDPNNGIAKGPSEIPRPDNRIFPNRPNFRPLREPNSSPLPLMYNQGDRESNNATVRQPKQDQLDDMLRKVLKEKPLAPMALPPFRPRNGIVADPPDDPWNTTVNYEQRLETPPRFNNVPRHMNLEAPADDVGDRIRGIARQGELLRYTGNPNIPQILMYNKGTSQLDGGAQPSMLDRAGDTARRIGSGLNDNYQAILKALKGG
jgi:hypothetical protein